jgi:hypothetical protein
MLASIVVYDIMGVHKQPPAHMHLVLCNNQTSTCLQQYT